MNWIHEIATYRHHSITHYEPLVGGLTNANFVVTFDDGVQWAVRVPYSHNAHLFNYPNEALVVASVWPLGIDVPLHYFNKETGVKATTYLPQAKTLKDPSLWTRKTLTSLAAHLHALHRLDGAAVGCFNPIQKYHHYRSDIRTPLHEFPESELILSIREMYAKYHKVLCHNDLVPGNIMVDGETVYLIDYEYAGRNIPLFDVVSLLNENNRSYDDPLILHFLESYYQRPLTPEDERELRLLDAYLCMLWHAWANRHYELTHESIYFDIAEEKFHRYCLLSAPHLQ